MLSWARLQLGSDGGDAANQSKTCAICYDDMTCEVARPYGCRHFFCRPCLVQFCRKVNASERRCPLDRKRFDSICVRRNLSTARETQVDAATMTPIDSIFASPNVAIGLGSVLLVVLCAAPNWLFALHIMALGFIYYRTEGHAVLDQYFMYYFIFFLMLVPINFIGLIATIYAWLSCLLMSMCAASAPQLMSSNSDKALFTATAILVGLVFPALQFTVYTLLQSYCYIVCLILVHALMAKLQAAHGQPLLRICLLFSSLLLVPYLCQLPQLGLLHLAYCCLLISCLLFRGPTHQNVRFTAKLACTCAPSVLLGFSPFTAVYSLAAVVYADHIRQQTADRLHRVRLLLGVNVAMVGLLLPWKLFGVLPFFACFAIVGASLQLVDRLVDKIDSLPANNQEVTVIAFHLAALGVLLPLVLF